MPEWLGFALFLLGGTSIGYGIFWLIGRGIREIVREEIERSKEDSDE